jgi:hypothetical protein
VIYRRQFLLNNFASVGLWATHMVISLGPLLSMAPAVRRRLKKVKEKLEPMGV